MKIQEIAQQYNKAARKGNWLKANNLMNELDNHYFKGNLPVHCNLHYLSHLFPPIILSIDYSDPDTGDVVATVHIENKPGFVDTITNKENW